MKTFLTLTALAGALLLTGCETTVDDRGSDHHRYGSTGVYSDHGGRDGYRHDSYRNDYRGDGYRSDSYRDDGYRSDGYARNYGNDEYRTSRQVDQRRYTSSGDMKVSSSTREPVVYGGGSVSQPTVQRSYATPSGSRAQSTHVQVSTEVSKKHKAKKGHDHGHDHDRQ